MQTVLIRSVAVVLTWMACSVSMGESSLSPQQPQEAEEDRTQILVNTRFAFAMFDADQDNTLHLEEVPRSIWELIATVDQEGDGSISRSEFVSFAYRPVFERLDRDADKVIVESEVDPSLWRKIVVADQNGDGRVSIDEYLVELPSLRVTQSSQADGDPIVQIELPFLSIRVTDSNK